MDFKKINIVVGREFSIRVKKKSFIITTILGPIFFAALVIVPSLIMMNKGEEDIKKVMIVDESGVVSRDLSNTKSIAYQANNGADIDSLKKHFSSLGVDAVVLISKMDDKNNVKVSAFSDKQLTMGIKSDIESKAEKAIEAYKLSTYDIENLDLIMNDVNTSINLDTYTIDKEGVEKKSMVELSMGISYVLSFFIYIFVIMFGNMVMRSVIDEKSSRIVEVIVSSIKPFDLMIGKIAGVACVAITQFLIWIVLTVAFILGFQLIAGGDFLSSGAVPPEIIAGQMGAISNSPINGIFAAIANINFPYILGCFLIYFVLGYLLYSAMFAAVGSAVDNEADTQQLIMPITMPMILGLFIMIHTFQHPDSSLSFWASMIPFTSPMVMLARIPFEGGVPLWELLLSIGLLLATFLVIVFLSGKIYRVGILMYGKKVTWKDLMKWIKY